MGIGEAGTKQGTKMTLLATDIRNRLFPGIQDSELEEAELLADIIDEPDAAKAVMELREWLPESAFQWRTTGNVYTRLYILTFEGKPVTVAGLRETLTRFPDDQVAIAVDDIEAILKARHEQRTN